MSYNTCVRMDQGGNKLTVAAGGVVNIETGGEIQIAGTAVTTSAAELNILDGVTSTTAELNSLDGVVNPLGSTAALKQVAAGEYTMVQADDDAGLATIASGLTAVESAIVQVVDAADAVVGADAVIAFAAGNITVGDGAATYDCTAGHKVRWIAYGA